MNKIVVRDSEATPGAKGPNSITTSGHDRMTVEATNRKRTILFVVSTVIALCVVMLVTAIFMRLDIFEAGPHVAFALLLGTLFSILIGVGLMALVFYSDRSGHDEDVSRGSSD